MSENYINKIKIGTDEYEIQASSIGDVSEVNFTNGNNTGVVELNEKGNLSVESLSKHVNLEAKQAIQMKPTTSIILDTTRKLKLPQPDNVNEAVVKVVYDDYEKDGQNNARLDDERYGYLKIHSRATDLRCYDHGGIALQPCGIDGSGNENKIKFESSRKVDANTEIPDDLRRNSSNYSDYYSNEGGKGTEFGTFNNEHTSLYTKDYRFNSEGKVYSVTRGIVSNASGKFDYPTQNDDFKDIPIDDTGVPGVYNSTSKEWEIDNNSSGKYLVSSSWNSIIKTAHALNDQPWTDTNISGKGNLQITASDEYSWTSVEDPAEEVDSEHTLTADTETPKYKYYADGGIYKLSDDTYATCSRTDHHLNLEAESTIKLETKHNDLELLGGQKIQIESKNIKIEASDVDETTGVNYGVVDFSTTPNVSFMAKKINKRGVFEETNAVLSITSLNNLSKTIYENTTDDYIRITNDVLYTGEDTLYVPQLIKGKTRVYTNSSATENPVKDDIYFIKYGGATFLIEINKDLQAKKEPKICDTDHTILYTSEDTVFEPYTNTSTNIALYLDNTAQTVASEGYYLVEESNSTYIIYINSENKRSSFVYGIDTTDPDNPTNLSATSILADDFIVTGYNKITFGGNDEAESNEVATQSGAQMNVGTVHCSIKDIVDLINFFKPGGDGQANGPWAEPASGGE